MLRRSWIVLAAMALAAAQGRAAAIVYAGPPATHPLSTPAVGSHATAASAAPRGPVIVGTPAEARRAAAQMAATGRKPNIPNTTVCTECKRRGLTCVMVAEGTPCLGPVTHSGCGALCPAVSRGCYGCFGPAPDPNLESMTGWLRTCGMSEADISRIFATFNVAAFDTGTAGARDDRLP